MSFSDYVKFLSVSEDQIHSIGIPSNVKNSIQHSTVSFATSTISFIFGAIFIVLMIILWFLVPLRVIKIVHAIIISILIAFVLFMATLLYSSVLNKRLQSSLNSFDSQLHHLTTDFLTKNGAEIKNKNEIPFNINDLEF